MKLGEFEIETDDLVYVPSDDTFLLAENLNISYGDNVLEIGTGTGLVAMYASKLTNKVTATDINYNALELAEKNITNNNIKNIELLFGDLFEPVKNRKFDLIIFNTPYLPTSEEETLDNALNFAFDGGPDGRKVIDVFLNQVKNYLNPKGKVQLIQSSLSNIEKTIKKLNQNGFIAEIAESEKFFFEEIVLINGYLI
jgi:release factor glutamine methyltransferase